MQQQHAVNWRRLLVVAAVVAGTAAVRACVCLNFVYAIVFWNFPLALSLVFLLGICVKERRECLCASVHTVRMYIFVCI